MAKAIKKYTGGIHGLIQAAVREDGALFMRFQNKTRWGYRWTAWKFVRQLDTANLPESIEAGFSTLYWPSIYTDFNPRLPA